MLCTSRARLSVALHEVVVPGQHGIDHSLQPSFFQPGPRSSCAVQVSAHAVIIEVRCCRLHFLRECDKSRPATEQLGIPWASSRKQRRFFAREGRDDRRVGDEADPDWLTPRISVASAVGISPGT